MTESTVVTLEQFSIGGIRLLLAAIVVVVLGASAGYALRSATLASPVRAGASSVSRTPLGYDDWVHDQAVQSAASAVPDDSRVPSGAALPTHEGR